MTRNPRLAVAAMIGAMALAGHAHGADLIVEQQQDVVPPTPVYSWAGAYAGVLAGYGWGDKHAVDVDEPDEFADYDVHGIVGGFEVGYNWQSADWVYGVEADFLFSGIDGDGRVDDEDPLQTDINHIATLTGRLGKAFDRTLIYLEGGAAWVHEDHQFFGDFDDNPELSDTVSEDRFGGVIGGGIEYALNGNWIAKLEYNYMHFGSEETTYHIPAPANETEFLDIDQNLHTLKVGLKYKF